MTVIVLGGIGVALYGIGKAPAAASFDPAAAAALKAQIAEHENFIGQLQTLLAEATSDEDPDVYRTEINREIVILNDLGAQLKKLTGA